MSALSQQCARLPQELLDEIVAVTDVQTCAILQCLGALRLLLRHRYLHSDLRSHRKDRHIAMTCVVYRWSAGVEELIAHGIHDPFVLHGQSLEHIVLPIRSLERLCTAAKVARKNLRSCFSGMVWTLWCTNPESPTLKYCQDNGMVDVNDTIARHLRSGGTADSLLKLLERFAAGDTLRTFSPAIAGAAITDRRPDVLEWLHARQPAVLQDCKPLLWAAMTQDDVPTIEYLLDVWTKAQHKHTLKQAIKANKKTVVQKLQECLPTTQGSGRASVAPDLACGAAAHGQLRVLQWLVGNGLAKLSPEVRNRAATAGCLPVLEWICAQDSSPLSHKALRFAISSGNVDAARWVWEHMPKQGPQEIELCEKGKRTAMESGNLDLLDWLLEIAPDNRMTSFAMIHALEKGQLEAAQLLYKRTHCLPTRMPMTLYNLAQDGRLDVFHWLVVTLKIELQLRSEVLDAALSSGYLALVKLVQPLVLGATYGNKQLQRAAESGYLHTVQWVRRHMDPGCRTTGAMGEAARRGFLDIVRWLHVNGQDDCTTDAMDSAAAYGQLQVLEYLQQHRQEGCTEMAVVHAAMAGHLDVLLFLRNHYPHFITTDAIGHARSPGTVKWLHSNGFPISTPQG
ncbi:hypothetical protein RI367_004268 [Sorochytrium milnesiophthora]